MPDFYADATAQRIAESKTIRFEAGVVAVDGQRHVTVAELEKGAQTFAGAVTFAGPVVFQAPLSMPTVEAAFDTCRAFAVVTDTLAATGATTLAATSCTTLAVTGAVTCAGITVGVGGTAALKNTAVTGTLGVTGATTLAAASCTTLSASGATTLAAVSCTTLTASTGLTLGASATVSGLETHLVLDLASLVAGGVYGLPSPVAGTITRIQVRLKDPIATADAVVVPRIGATVVTAPTLTVALAGTVRGAVYAVVPTALNVVAIGSDINLTITGTQSNAVGATAVITIKRSS